MSSKKFANSKTKARTMRTTKAPDRKLEFDPSQPCSSKDIPSQQADNVARSSSDGSQASTPSNVERNTATNSFVGSTPRRQGSRKTSFSGSAIKSSAKKAKQYCDESAHNESSDSSKARKEYVPKKKLPRHSQSDQSESERKQPLPKMFLRAPLRIDTGTKVSVLEDKVKVESTMLIRSADVSDIEIERAVDQAKFSLSNKSATHRESDRIDEHTRHYAIISEHAILIHRETTMQRAKRDTERLEAKDRNGYANISECELVGKGFTKRGRLGLVKESGVEIDNDVYVNCDKIVMDVGTGKFDYNDMCEALKSFKRLPDARYVYENVDVYESVRVIGSRIILDREVVMNVRGDEDIWANGYEGRDERRYDYEVRDAENFLACRDMREEGWKAKSALKSSSSSSSRSKSKRSRSVTFNEATKPYEENKAIPKKYPKTTYTKRSKSYSESKKKTWQKKLRNRSLPLTRRTAEDLTPAPKASSECLSQTLNDTTGSGSLRAAETKHSDYAMDAANLATSNGSANASKLPGETPILGGATPPTTKQSSARKDVTQSAKKGGTSGDKTSKSTSKSKQSSSSKKQTSNKRNSAKSTSKTSDAATNQTMEELEARAKTRATESGPRPSARRNLFGIDGKDKMDELANLAETSSKKSIETWAKKSGSAKKSPKHGNDSVKETKLGKKAAKELNSTSSSKKKSVQTTTTDAKTRSKDNAPVTDMNVSALSAAQLYADSHNNDAVAGPSHNGSLFTNRSTSSNEANHSLSSSKKKNKTSGIGLTYGDCSSSALSTPCGSGKKNHLDSAKKIVIPSSAAGGSKRNSLNKSLPQARASPPKSNEKSVSGYWADCYQKRKPNVTKNEAIPHSKLDDFDDTEVDKTLPVVSKSTEIDISSGSKQDAQHTTTKIVQVSAFVNGRKVVLSSRYRFKHNSEQLSFVPIEVKFCDA